MQDSSIPTLAQDQWYRVRRVMKDVGDRDCRKRPREFLARWFGKEPLRAATEMDAVRRFVCDASFGRTPSAEASAQMASYGFGESEMAAIRMLAA